MTEMLGKIVLGSRSPRRHALLQQVVDEERIWVRAADSTEEAGFEDVEDWRGIEGRLLENARGKSQDVSGQIEGEAGEGEASSVSAVIAADTVIVIETEEERLKVLGKPPEEPGWEETVRRWFREYYFGRWHWAMTGLCVSVPGGERAERTVRTQILFDPGREDWLEWYIRSGEPRGKAGGYGLQGAGSVFCLQLVGSLSNVIGLPLLELLEALKELQIDGSWKSD